MVVIGKQTEEANKTKIVVEKEEKEASTKQKECSEIKNSAEKDLAEALPALENAVKQVKLLNVKEIKEVSSYTNPTPGVIMCMEAVLIMKGVQPTKVQKDGKTTLDYWEKARKMLFDAKNLKNELVNFEKDKIKEKTIKKISKYIDKEEFKPKNIVNVSKALYSMCLWVRAMYKYYHVSRDVEPKRLKLKQAREELKVVEKRLAIAKGKLDSVTSKINKLQEENDKSVKIKTKLEKELNECTVKLNRAERLIDGLAGEKIRWNQTLIKYNEEMENLIGDILINAGTVAYLGVFTQEFRDQLRNEWMNKMKELNISFRSSSSVEDLVDGLEIRTWTQSGLPTDKLSIENAIILKLSRRFPLIIDPQLQANKWIKNMYKNQNLKIINFNQKDFARTLINSIQLGYPVLLENVGEDIDPTIEPVLLKQVIIQGGAPYLKIGEDMIPFNKDFKFFITTKLRNPHYTPETSVKVTLLNFFITPKGLQDQLLGSVVSLEAPKLQEMKLDLMIKNVKLNKDLKQIQDNILKMLNENKGEVLENEKLINALQDSKIASGTIKEQVKEAKKTEKEIDETRNEYLPVAIRGSLLFFCISDMANIDPMYQYSLQWFISLFIQSIEKAEGDENLKKRVQNLIHFFTYSLYNNVCQSLFEKHKLLFSFVLCTRIEKSLNHIDEDEWRFLTTGGNSEKKIVKPNVDWLTEESWQEYVNLSVLPGMIKHDLIDVFINNIVEFTDYFESEKPQDLPIPGGLDKKITLFQKILVLRCFRNDKVTAFITNYVTELMGTKFVNPPRFDIARSFKDSTNMSPLVFILSSGADPKSELDKFAEVMRIKNMEQVSLGRGQEKKSVKAITSAISSGNWVLLQNCHLSTSFMPTLEKICENLDQDTHRDFRLWLTSLPNKNFPPSILQNSVKMTLEPPKGLKSNLMGSYDNFNDEYLTHPTKPEVFKKLIFGLCFFHAIIQERRKFGPLGWNKPYGFTKGDLTVCLQQLRLFLEKYQEVPYKVIKFLSGQINYGGRVTDKNDKRTLMTIIDTFITDKIMDDDYIFSPIKDYYSIKAGNYNEYLSYLEKLPQTANPEVFGLHSNALITYNKSEFVDMTNTIISMQPRGSAGGSHKKEVEIERISSSLLKNCPPIFDMAEIMKKFPTKYEESMNTFLVQEITKYNRLLKIIHQSLKSIKKALKGEVVMSKELEEMGHSLFNNQVPKLWSSKSYPSLMPLSSWIEDLLKRVKFLTDWVKKGSNPNVFWISGFFFPQGFMTGLLQNYARKHVVAIDTVSFDFKIFNKKPEEMTEPPSEGAYVYGFYAEGARWCPKKNVIIESRPKELYTEFPIIWFKPVINRVKPSKGIYECPCYKTLRRMGELSTTGHSTNYIISVEIPSDKPQSHWIKRGVALICALRSASL